MFPWNIAKSAENMFSRWAMKRVFKFLLKKKLGQFILGDIDLDQLDVQLRAGTIQLSDLALNVDFLNQKLGQAGQVTIKEGSIGSLLVSMPWNGNGFEVEIDELEMLLTPCAEHLSRTNDETSTSDQGRSINHESIKINRESGEDCMAVAMDIHEGVKTVARMLKLFLTSFHVKIKRLIVAYDPYSNRDGSNLGVCPNLVLRVSEIECGTCVSEDAASESGTDAQNILGISCLTNIFSFRGAILELLLICDVGNHSSPPAVESLYVEQIHESGGSSTTTPIVTGEGGGFFRDNEVEYTLERWFFRHSQSAYKCGSCSCFVKDGTKHNQMDYDVMGFIEANGERSSTANKFSVLLMHLLSCSHLHWGHH